MKMIQQYFKFLPLIGFLFLTLVACTNTDDDNPTLVTNDGLKILNFGDSRVDGAPPEFESYRYELWKKLVQNDWEIDFVGPYQDDFNYPIVNGMPFDPDHAGVGGYQTTDGLDVIDVLLERLPQLDVVLMDLGGNDLLEGRSVDATIANVNQLIDIIQAEYPNVTIFVEQIAPGISSIMTAELTPLFNDFNAQIAQVASQQTSTSSKVIAIDMYTGFTDAYLADALHYNEAGAKFVADRYYTAMDANINR